MHHWGVYKCPNQLIILHLIFHFLHFDKEYTSSFVILSYHLIFSILFMNWRCIISILSDRLWVSVQSSQLYRNILQPEPEVIRIVSLVSLFYLWIHLLDCYMYYLPIVYAFLYHVQCLVMNQRIYISSIFHIISFYFIFFCFCFINKYISIF